MVAQHSAKNIEVYIENGIMICKFISIKLFLKKHFTWAAY